MNFARRVFVEKRLPVTIVVATIAIDIGLHVFAVYPWSVKVANASKRAETARCNLEIAKQNFAEARITMKSKTQADEELQRFYVDILPRDLAGARGVTYPRLAALARQTNLLIERRSAEPSKDEDSHLARLRTAMLLRGHYGNIRRFIYELETAPEFIVIEEVVLSESGEADSTLVLTLGVATYYRTK